MGRASACLSFGFFVLQCFAAVGDEAVSTAPSPASKLGQLFVRNTRADAFERLPVARLQMHVVLRPPVALVQLDQTFFSPFTDEREGTFAIDLPTGAAVSRFAMSAVSGRLVEAELIGKPRAVEIHKTVTRGRQEVKSPEQTGDHLFQMRVFPIAGRGVKRVLLDYTLPLTAAGSRYHFRLPLNSDGALPDEQSGEHSGEDGPPGPSPTTGTAWEGHPPREPILDFCLTGEIHPFVGQIAAEEVTSTSHPDLACQTRADGSLAFSLTRRQYQPPAEFAISFPVARQRPPVAVRSYRARGRTGEATDADTYYFLAQINRHGRMAATAPADVLVLADTSSGITEPDTVRQVAASIIKNLRREDRFQLGCVDMAYRPLTQGWTVPGSPDAVEACAAVDRQLFLGETDLIGCFQQALEKSFATSEGRRRVVIYIGDAHNTVPGTATQGAFAGVLDEQLKNAGALFAVYLVPVTLSPDSPRFLEKFARLSPVAGGAGWAMYAAYGMMNLVVTPFRLAPITRDSGGVLFDGRQPARAEGELLQWLSLGLPTRPRLNKIEVEGARPEELYYLPDIAGDGSLQVLGRTTRGGRAKLTLSLAEGLEQSVEEYEIEIDPRDENLLLGRFWAQHRVDELTAKSPQDKSPELTEIVELSQEWGLLSPYMALLLLESESDYARWQIDPRIRRRYWQPAEAPPPFVPPAAWLRPPEESPADKQAAAERFAKLLALARESLDRSDYEASWAQLEALRRLLPAAASNEFAELAKRAQSGLRRATLFDRLGARRRLIDPLANPVSLHRSFEPGRLLWASCSPEFLRTQPHADRWLEELEVFADSWTLAEWAKLLGDRSGVSVVLDRKSLDDVGIDEDTRLQVVGQGRLSLRSLLRHAFRRADIAVIDEPHCFVITSRLGAENRLTTHVYPVADLLTPGESAGWELLADPYLDREEATHRRISARLAQPISLSYSETSLRDVIEQFASRLKAAVVIDVEAVQEARNDLTTPVTGAFSDAPLGESLRWALDELDLTYTLRDEALLITSKTEAENMLRVDLHSGRDLLREYLTPIGPDGRLLRNNGMGGGGMFSIDSEVAWPVGLGFAPEKRYNMSAIQTATKVALAAQPFATRRLLGNQPIVKPTAVFAPDENAVIDLVTSTIEPTSWDEVGGPGTVRFFEPTLDFVIDATDDVHRQIERLFASLRKLPPVESRSTSDGQGRRISRPAAMPSGGKRLLPPDEQSFIDLITSSVAPTTWDEVGGPGAIRADMPHLALVISQTQEIHAEITRLFTLLRRSRYAATHGDRPWEAEFLSGAPFGGLAGNSPWGGLGRPSSEQAAADPASLAVLAAVRREPHEGVWRWAYSRPAAAETIELHRQADRMELVLGEQSVRIDGADAAVLYPGLALVEIGPWADAAHALADGYLPWLTHRTNEELARMFTVEALPATEADKQARQSRIRLRFVGLEDNAQTYLETAFSHEHRLPTTWQAFVDGELTLRLQFKDLIDYRGRKEWRQTILEDAGGVEIAAWRLVDAADKDATPAGEIADGAFAGLMVVDRRPRRAAPDADFAVALQALRKSDWSGADQRLAKALIRHPQQPLLLFLRAWCHARDPVRASDAQARDWLAEVAGSSAVALTRAITEGQFPFLSVEERYDLLARQPAALRTPLDEQHLASAAQAARRFEAALVHVDAARRLLANGGVTEPFELVQLHVETLLRLDRKDEAAEAALQWAVARSGIRKNSGRDLLPPSDFLRSRLQADAATAPHLIDLAELLRKHDLNDAADRLLALALDRPGVTADERYDLLLRRANCHRGLERWQWIVRAIDPPNLDARLREAGLAVLLEELSDEEQADAAAQLAQQCQSEALRTRLLVHQAELTPKLPGVELCWRLAQTNRLPADRLSWAAARFNQAEQPARTVEMLEGDLRAGRFVPPVALRQLELAYLLLNRPADARRASTADPGWGNLGMGAP
ncbi:MAG TPA: VIT and VWA domain-containing protein [Pirellulales bacterium]